MMYSGGNNKIIRKIHLFINKYSLLSFDYIEKEREAEVFFQTIDLLETCAATLRCDST